MPPNLFNPNLEDIMSSIFLQRDISGGHRCEVAEKLEKYLPCPVPGCKYGVTAQRVYVSVPDDYVYAIGKEEKLPTSPRFLREVFERRRRDTGKWFWHFLGEET